MSSRALEVKRWLRYNPVKAFVIVDDLDDFDHDQKDFLVKPDSDIGLTMEQTNQALSILSQQLDGNQVIGR